MSKRQVTTDELRAMIASPRKLPPPETLEYTGVWLPVLEDYRLEYAARQITHLRREKILLRAAVQETINELYKAAMFSEWYVTTWWQERVLKRTKDNTDGATGS